jgi:Peptidase family C25
MRVFVTYLILLTMALLVLSSAFLAPGKSSQNGNYVILTNIPETDPFYSAVTLLGSYRAATTVRFLNNVNESLTSLKSLMPEYVAVAVKPQTISVDFVSQTYLTLSQLDDDQYIDCPVGFITGATPDDMLLLVNNTIKAENSTRPAKYTAIINSNTTFGGEGGALCRAQVYSNLFAGAGWQTSLVDLYHKPSDIYQKMSGSSVTTIDMHGYATYIENLTSAEVKNGPQQYLFPTVAIASPCYTAVTTNFVEECYCVNETVDPNNSFSLSFIKKGAVGYIGHLRMYGVNWAALEPALYGMSFLALSQGEALKQSLNLGFLSQGVPANITTHGIMLFGYVLYGDPKYTPIQQSISTPLIDSSYSVNQSSLLVQLRLNRNVTFPYTLNGTWIHNSKEWSDFSGATWASNTINYRLQLPSNLSITRISLVNFSDPANELLMVYGEGTIYPIEKTPAGTFLYLHMTFQWKNQTCPLKVPAGTKLDLRIDSTSVIPEFSGPAILLPILAATTIMVTAMHKISMKQKTRI